MQLSSVLTVVGHSEIKNSAVVEKLHNAVLPHHLELTMTAIKIGAVGINHGYWKLCHWLITNIWLSIIVVHSKAPFTRYNLLSNRLSNPFDNRLYRVSLYNIQPVVKPCLSNRLYKPVWQRVERTAVRSTRLSNPFDNRLNSSLIYSHICAEKGR